MSLRFLVLQQLEVSSNKLKNKAHHEDSFKWRRLYINPKKANAFAFDMSILTSNSSFQRDLFKYHCDNDTGKLLFLACQKLCQMLANDVPMTTPVGLNLPSEIHDLACQAATICSPGDKIDHMCSLILLGSWHTCPLNAVSLHLDVAVTKWYLHFPKG